VPLRLLENLDEGTPVKEHWVVRSPEGLCRDSC